MQYKVMVSFINEDGANFHKILKMFVVINFVWVIRPIGTTNTPSIVKIQEVTLNSWLI